ncbi:MAG: branched-chain amino acid ABC transporter permease [Acidimicrobiia bacterium]|nr:branched-chain amino acid ABC transporter permease [Acidimicrobiia bacterium]
MASGVIAQTYRQDMALRRGSLQWLGVAAVAALALVYPFWADARWETVGVFVLIAATAGLGLHVLTGLAGQVSLGHSAFVGVGAYTAIWLGADHGMPMWVWLPVSGLVPAAVALLVAPFAARVRGLYLAVVSVALIFVANYFWNWWDWLTGGFNGRTAQPTTVMGHNLFDDLDVFGLVHLNSNEQFWFLVLAVFLPLALAARNIQRTRIGRAFMSVRERDLAASVAGVPVTRTKVLGFVVAAFYAGVAGSLLAAYQSYVVPSQWNLLLAISYIAMIVIGGLGSVLGVVLGAVFVTALPTFVESLADVLPLLTDKPSTSGGLTVDLVSTFLYGLAIVVVMVAEPRGIMGLWERFKLFWRSWPWSP